jgi:hypothetical protein
MVIRGELGQRCPMGVGLGEVLALGVDADGTGMDMPGTG